MLSCYTFACFNLYRDNFNWSTFTKQSATIQSLILSFINNSVLSVFFTTRTAQPQHLRVHSIDQGAVCFGIRAPTIWARYARWSTRVDCSWFGPFCRWMHPQGQKSKNLRWQPSKQQYSVVDQQPQLGATERSLFSPTRTNGRRWSKCWKCWSSAWSCTTSVYFSFFSRRLFNVASWINGYSNGDALGEAAHARQGPYVAGKKWLNYYVSAWSWDLSLLSVTFKYLSALSGICDADQAIKLLVASTFSLHVKFRPNGEYGGFNSSFHEKWNVWPALR